MTIEHMRCPVSNAQAGKEIKYREALGAFVAKPTMGSRGVMLSAAKNCGRMTRAGMAGIRADVLATAEVNGMDCPKV